MSDDNNIKNYSAIDIQRYHEGKMTPEEMHSMEKAALDDPFLADALEGYATAEPASITGDMKLMKEKLIERVNSGKVVAMPVRKTIDSAWMRAAAMLILIAGFGWLIYQFVFKKTSVEVASAKNKSVSQPSKTDSNQFLNISPAPVNDAVSNQQKEIKNETKKERTNIPAPDNIVSDTINTSDKTEVAAIANHATNSPVISQERTNIPPAAGKEDSRNNSDVVLRKAKSDDNAGAPGVYYKAEMSRQVPAQKTNLFRGQVLDATNNPLPFANITNTRDNIGTYTDAKGNFTLISPDSVLNVQVKSLGFENGITQLRNDLEKNQVVLQPDSQKLNELVISNKRTNTQRSRSKILLEEPQPADGWYNYDTYIANNLNATADVKSRQQSGEVEVSFDINKKGEPFNIKIDKSLCQKCDEEAIRLVKEGPKWKKKGKKTRARVTIAF